MVPPHANTNTTNSYSSGPARINADRTHDATNTPFWLNASCLNSTTPWLGRDLDRRAETTVVLAEIVSPAKTGAGKTTSENPKLATVVPCVVSWTVMPTCEETRHPAATTRRQRSMPRRRRRGVPGEVLIPTRALERVTRG